MKDFREQNYYELLEVTVHASQQEIEDSYRQARRAFASDSVATYALFSPEELVLLRRRIEEAYRVLTDAERRRLYDRELSRLDSTQWPDGETPADTKQQEQRADEQRQQQEQEPDNEDQPRLPLVESKPPPPADEVAEVDPVVTEPAEPVESEPVESEPVESEPVESEPVESESAEPESAEPKSGEPKSGEPETVVLESTKPEPVGPESVAPPAGPALPRVEKTESGPATDAPSAGEAASTRQEEQLPPLPRIDDDTPIDGELLRRVRLARGLELERIAEITKISIYYLRNLEIEDFTNLPARVYVRGYLKQLCSILELDASRIVDAYLARLDAGGGREGEG